MVAIQVMASDAAVTFGGACGYLEMNVYKPVIIHNIMHSIRIMTDACRNFRLFLVDGTKPNKKRINDFLQQPLMLVTAINPLIGYEKASKVALDALKNNLTLKEAVLKLKCISEAEFDRVVDPAKMVYPRVAKHEGGDN
ncbi:MAG: hypothetical protein WCB79_09075 [Halobacteriota archaeon]